MKPHALAVALMAAVSGCEDPEQSIKIDNATSAQYAQRFKDDAIEMRIVDRVVSDSCLRQLIGTNLPKSATMIEHEFRRGSGETSESITFFLPDPASRRAFLDSFKISIREILKERVETSSKKDEDDNYAYYPHLNSVGGPPYWKNDTFDAEKRYDFSYSLPGIHDDTISLSIDLQNGRTELRYHNF